ncbi:uncharacterized protein LOC133466619 [Phyllopteryx taeniolatus]|uniref:uncharacterized protein LOC133466619 n=1 Tax=Phyllopteryx taeniolatus TaxID=161469 RepID=UPI002AD371A0|nr:uncharacterized protein LOC133466619 [Phyllopteryx taeniolatus]
MLQRRVNQDSTTTSRAFRNSRRISSTPGTLPLGDLNPRDGKVRLREPRLCSLMGRRVGGIEEVFGVFSPPAHNVPSRGQLCPIPTIHSVDGALLPPPETPDGGPEFPRSRPEVFLHGLTELLSRPWFCFSDHQSCIPLGQPVPISCLSSHCTRPLWPLPQVVSPGEGGPTLPFRAAPMGPGPATRCSPSSPTSRPGSRGVPW